MHRDHGRGGVGFGDEIVDGPAPGCRRGAIQTAGNVDGAGGRRFPGETFCLREGDVANGGVEVIPGGVGAEAFHRALSNDFSA